MKSVRILFLFAFFLCLVFAASSFAADTDLYVGGGSGVKPNILIVFDTSGSMNDTVDTGNQYDADYAYPADPDHLDIIPTVVYKKNSNGSWFPLNVFKDSVSEVGCPTAQSVLSSDGKGVYYGRPNWDASKSRCTGGQVTLATGNWLNFYLASDGIIGNMKKIDIAKQVTKNFLDTVEDVRVGVMRFGSITQSGGTDSDEGGRIVYDIIDLTDDNRSNIKSAIDNLSASGWTPLAEVLYEAGLYFKGAQSYFNWINSTTKKQYTSPIQYYCQKNYTIIMTDGISTEDRNSILGTAIGDLNDDLREPPGAANDPGYGSNGSDYLDDAAKYYYDGDFRSDLQNQQNLVTYTIGYELSDTDPDSPKARDLLQRTAQLGHGKYFSANNTAGLADAFTTILSEILAKTSSFVAPIVPVSRLERTMAGDKIYLAFFKPELTGLWSGNIKKYGVAQARDTLKGIEVGDILDASDSKALDSSGQFYATSRSYWTTSGPDGGEVEKGGVGEVLKNRTSARQIYTYLGTNSDLAHSSNAFIKTNTSITTSMLGVSTTEEKDKIIDYVHGYDAYDDDGNGNTAEKREWILGSFLHSRPFIIHYADRTVIYAGANDGMLHAFDDTTGEELWAFIPPNLLGRLYELHTDYPGIFVDGCPKAYITYDSNGYPTKAILIFGLRRGGNKYYALDVTDPLCPKYAWKIDPDTMSQFTEMGQSWSSPVMGKIASGTGEQWIAIIGGGYDDGQDEDNPPADDRGRAIYMLDVLTGSFVWKYSYAENSTMTYCIPSDITKLDVNGDGKIDRLYVGDTNARMWRFDIGNSDNTASWTGRIIFQSNTGASEKRKIFYPPDVTFERQDGVDYELLFFGTGDREHPKNTDVNKINRLYAVKDKNVMTILKDIDLVDVTGFYSQTQEGQATMINDIKTMSGWYIVLENSGEKCLASPVVFYKIVYYTTFSPTPGSITDPCFVGEGTARLYALNYATGEAVFNMDLTNDTSGTVIAKSDRLKVIGTAIPSGVIITIIGGAPTAYVGVGGGVYSPQLSTKKSLFPLYWKLVF
jgi:type IV pilus assembly protein PilY1